MDFPPHFDEALKFQATPFPEKRLVIARRFSNQGPWTIEATFSIGLDLYANSCFHFMQTSHTDPLILFTVEGAEPHQTYVTRQRLSRTESK